MLRWTERQKLFFQLWSLVLQLFTVYNTSSIKKNVLYTYTLQHIFNSFYPWILASVVVQIGFCFRAFPRLFCYKRITFI